MFIWCCDFPLSQETDPSYPAKFNSPEHFTVTVVINLLIRHKYCKIKLKATLALSLSVLSQCRLYI